MCVCVCVWHKPLAEPSAVERVTTTSLSRVTFSSLETINSSVLSDSLASSDITPSPPPVKNTGSSVLDVGRRHMDMRVMELFTQ